MHQIRIRKLETKNKGLKRTDKVGETLVGRADDTSCVGLDCEGKYHMRNKKNVLINCDQVLTLTVGMDVGFFVGASVFPTLGLAVGEDDPIYQRQL